VPEDAVKTRVVLTSEPATAGRTRWFATCTVCGWTYHNVVKTDVAQQKRWHTDTCRQETT
jgi:hypothetical protein